ncbi:MAG: sigma-70 family RNA polymerase sigma factor [Marinifilaceae bacterium]|jgi:RNA polymerase sigma-70 factor (ECF subfamily)|nr:sigma-70 family RNA polymerase sigma factor [Marinifilaceae bacterium]
MDDLYVDKVINGDVESFRYFVNTYKDYAFSLSISITKNSYNSEEAIQEAFIKAFENLSKYRGDSKFKTWFGRIVINESLKRVDKKNIKTLFIEDISEDYIKTLDETFCYIDIEDRKKMITEVFNSLKTNESLALELFYLKEHSTNDIIELTGWSKSKIKMLLSRGRKSFYYKLKNVLKYKLEELI